MKKQEMIRQMERLYGPWMNVNKVADYIGADRGTARRLLEGLPYLDGRSKRYAAVDVADRIIERMVVE